jgi:V/A-type H+-transporting ATPase subunit D
VTWPSGAPTRATELALREERAVVGEAYEFLDEKRLILAGQLLRQMEDYRLLRQELTTLAATARSRLITAVRRHGLQELSVYPPRPQDAWRIGRQQQRCMGVILQTTTLEASGAAAPEAASFPSGEAELCRQAFERLVELNVRLAGVSGNLYRLMAEYRLTERRARALDSVILPEIEQALKEISEHLEDLEREDAIRVRRQAGKR